MGGFILDVITLIQNKPFLYFKCVLVELSSDWIITTMGA